MKCGCRVAPHHKSREEHQFLPALKKSPAFLAQSLRQTRFRFPGMSGDRRVIEAMSSPSGESLPGLDNSDGISRINQL
jgi:hypothetical protein